MNKLHALTAEQTAGKPQKTLLWLALCVTCLITPAQADPLQEAADLTQLAETIREKKVPLLLAFEADHCNYCTRLKAEQLQPMNNNDSYRERVVIRTIKIDSSDKIISFNGEKTTPAELSRQYKAFLTPTMLFLNDKGEEIAERMLGYNSPDYFGAYLDQAIDTAGRKINETIN